MEFEREWQPALDDGMQFAVPLTCGESSHEVELRWVASEAKVRIGFRACQVIPAAARRIAGCDCENRLRELRRNFVLLFPCIWSDWPHKTYDSLPAALQQILCKIRHERILLAELIWRKLVGREISQRSVEESLDHPERLIRWSTVVLIGSRQLAFASLIEDRIRKWPRALRIAGLWSLMRIRASSSVPVLASFLTENSLGTSFRKRMLFTLASMRTEASLSALALFAVRTRADCNRCIDAESLVSTAERALTKAWKAACSRHEDPWQFLIRALFSLADNNNVATQQTIEEELDRTEAALVVPKLLAVLDGASPSLRGQSLWLLAVVLGRLAHQPDGLESFRLVAASPDKDVAIVAARAAHKLGHDAAQVFSTLLSRPEPAIQLSVVRALGQIDSRRTFEQILRVFGRSSVEAVQVVALEELEQFVAFFPLAPTPVVKSLSHAVLSRNRDIAASSARLLGETADGTAVAPLINAILSQHGANVVTEATCALAKLRRFVGADVIELLMKCLQTGSSVNAATEALVAIGPAAVPSLLKAVKWKFRDARRAALTALGRIGDPRALPSLRGGLSDKDRHVRDAAAVAVLQLTRRRGSKHQS